MGVVASSYKAAFHHSRHRKKWINFGGKTNKKTSSLSMTVKDEEKKNNYL